MSRLQVWALESRARYALVWGGINAAAVCSILLLARFPELYVGRALRFTGLALALSVSAQWLIGYPMAKRKGPTRHG